MRAILLSGFVFLALTATSQVVFDDGKAPSKQRSPELEALSFMTGKWNAEFILRETPESKEFKGKSFGITQWSPNGQFLISDVWGLVPGSPGFMPNIWGNQVSITTWDPIKKEYRITNVIASATETLTMTLEGTRITMRSESRNGGHITKTRSITERISDTEVKVRTECSIDGGPSWVFYEGTAKKISD